MIVRDELTRDGTGSQRTDDMVRITARQEWSLPNGVQGRRKRRSRGGGTNHARIPDEKGPTALDDHASVSTRLNQNYLKTF